MVERQLAACAHIAPIESFYRWQGAVQNDTEFKITFKTRAEHYAGLEAAIDRSIPTSCPIFMRSRSMRSMAPMRTGSIGAPQPVGAGGALGRRTTEAPGDALFDRPLAAERVAAVLVSRIVPGVYVDGAPPRCWRRWCSVSPTLWCDRCWC